MATVPNQKTVIVHKDKVVSDFLQINNAEWMEVNKKFGPYALQLYLYIAKNADGYKFALSPAAAIEEAGIKKTSYNNYLKLLETAGYIVKRSGNTYDFYTTPHITERQVDEAAENSSPYGDAGNSSDESDDWFHEQVSSPQEQINSRSNREIDNREYIF